MPRILAAPTSIPPPARSIRRRRVRRPREPQEPVNTPSASGRVGVRAHAVNAANYRRGAELISSASAPRPPRASSTSRPRGAPDLLARVRARGGTRAGRRAARRRDGEEGTAKKGAAKSQLRRRREENGSEKHGRDASRHELRARTCTLARRAVTSAAACRHRGATALHQRRRAHRPSAHAAANRDRIPTGLRPTQTIGRQHPPRRRATAARRCPQPDRRGRGERAVGAPARARGDDGVGPGMLGIRGHGLLRNARGIVAAGATVAQQAGSLPAIRLSASAAEAPVERVAAREATAPSCSSARRRRSRRRRA